jgi:outer membrane protein TolC
VGVLFSLPLTRTAERANYRASRDQQRQAELLLKQKEELVMREIADALALARSGLSRCQSSRQATDYAREALAAEQRKLVLGTGATGFVLQSQTDLARARANELMARRDYNIAVAQLRLAEGTLLERARFELTFR